MAPTEDRISDDGCCRKKRKPKPRPCGCRSTCRQFRGGVKTRNPFLNFLRAYRKRCCAKNVKEIARMGAKIWNRMSCKERAPFCREACKTPKRKRSTCRVVRRSKPCPR